MHQMWCEQERLPKLWVNFSSWCFLTIYTADKNFTQPPVALVAPNINSAQHSCWKFSWKGFWYLCQTTYSEGLSSPTPCYRAFKSSFCSSYFSFYNKDALRFGNYLLQASKEFKVIFLADFYVDDDQWWLWWWLMRIKGYNIWHVDKPLSQRGIVWCMCVQRQRQERQQICNHKFHK